MPGSGKIPMTLSLPPEDRRDLKRLAAERDTTVPALVSEWLHGHLAGMEDKAGTGGDGAGQAGGNGSEV